MPLPHVLSGPEGCCRCSRVCPQAPHSPVVLLALGVLQMLATPSPLPSRQSPGEAVGGVARVSTCRLIPNRAEVVMAGKAGALQGTVLPASQQAKLALAGVVQTPRVILGTELLSGCNLTLLLQPPPP